MWPATRGGRRGPSDRASAGEAALVVAAMSLLLGPPAGRALTFSSSVQRFEADGNG
jgi:hypothetical protein